MKYKHIGAALSVAIGLAKGWPNRHCENHGYTQDQPKLCSKEFHLYPHFNLEFDSVYLFGW